MAANTAWAEAPEHSLASIPAQCIRWAGLAFLIPCFIGARILLRGLGVNSIGAQLLLKLLNVNYTQHSEPVQGPALVVSNHVSWLDPMVLAAQCDVSFITSQDTGKHPFLGLITKIGGCLFVSRKPWTLRKEIAEIANQIEPNSYIAFYPEATSSNGSQVLPFHASFFEVAVIQNIPVQPVVLRWATKEAAYYGDMTFASHLMQVMSLAELELEVIYLPPLNPKDFASRKELCAAAEASIRTNF